MRVAVSGDHAGFELKETLLRRLADAGYEVTDLGAYSTEPVDYPDVAAEAARAVVSGSAHRGIVICGSGAGACIAANKIRGIRCTLSHDTYSAHQSVEHDDANMLALGARVVGTELAWEIVAAFLEARFSGEERHARRRAKVLALEDEGA